MSAGDVAKVSAWLTGQGFTVTGTARSRTFITFSGTAGQVARAFGTTIHNVSLDGQTHYANLTDPVLPAALAAVVDAITGLHDFRLQSHAKTRVVPAAEADAARPEFTSAISGSNFIAPGDFYTIYDESSLLSSNINGTGVPVAVMGQTRRRAGTVTFATSAGATHRGLSALVPVVTATYWADPGCAAGGDDDRSWRSWIRGDGTYAASVSPSAGILYVQPEASVLSAVISTGNVVGGTYTVSVTDSAGSGVGVPTGTITADPLGDIAEPTMGTLAAAGG